MLLRTGVANMNYSFYGFTFPVITLNTLLMTQETGHAGGFVL